MGNAHKNPLQKLNFQMSQYRRLYQKGAIIFLTIVTYNRQPIFNNPQNINLLRQVTANI